MSLAFVATGVSQALSTVPQRWDGWTDGANLLITISSLSFLIAAAALHLSQRDRKISRNTWLLAAVHAMMGFLGQVLLFRAFDLLTPGRLVALAYPLSIGTTILAYSEYSRIAIREKLGTQGAAALVLGLASVVFLACNSLLAGAR